MTELVLETQGSRRLEKERSDKADFDKSTFSGVEQSIQVVSDEILLHSKELWSLHFVTTVMGNEH